VNPDVVGPSSHPSCRTGLGGEYLGGFERPVPREVMYKDVFDALAKSKYADQPSRVDYAFRMGGDKIHQVANQQWLDNMMRYWEGR